VLEAYRGVVATAADPPVLAMSDGAPGLDAVR
jgi:hypothetical protein